MAKPLLVEPSIPGLFVSLVCWLISFMWSFLGRRCVEENAEEDCDKVNAKEDLSKKTQEN
jgi:hypothetical protein